VFIDTPVVSVGVLSTRILGIPLDWRDQYATNEPSLTLLFHLSLLKKPERNCRTLRKDLERFHKDIQPLVESPK
jgi:hypothetical protein